MNSTDMADLYADLSAVLATFTEALTAKGVLTDDEITNAAVRVLAQLTDATAGNAHPYLMLRILATPK